MLSDLWSVFTCMFDGGCDCFSFTIVTSLRMHAYILLEEGHIDMELVSLVNSGIINSTSNMVHIAYSNYYELNHHGKVEIDYSLIPGAVVGQPWLLVASA